MNPKTMRSLLALAGSLLLLTGLGLGLIPADMVGTTHCGAPWMPTSTDVYTSDLARSILGMGGSYADACAAATGGRGTFGAVLAVLGVLVLLGVALIVAARRPGGQARPTENG